jgi:GMP synthase-like glutamine amidotransferase
MVAAGLRRLPSAVRATVIAAVVVAEVVAEMAAVMAAVMATLKARRMTYAGAMRIFILQPRLDDPPSWLATFLQARGLAPELCRVEAGDAVPRSAAGLDAIAMLGGPMSVNDPLPWLADAQALLRDAVARGVPVAGHCLGGQLLAKALGAAVTANPQPEIGWCRLRVTTVPADRALAQAWLGDEADDAGEGGGGCASDDRAGLPVYQWHNETFAVPPGATLLASSAACAHQAFAVGPHLGMQFHIEVDAAKLDRWSNEAPLPGTHLAGYASVQTEAAMRADTARLLARSQKIAERIYTRWLGGVR